MLPVGGDDFDDGSDHHEDLDCPQGGLTTKLIDGPATDEENGNKGSCVSGYEVNVSNRFVGLGTHKRWSPFTFQHVLHCDVYGHPPDNEKMTNLPPQAATCCESRTHLSFASSKVPI